MFPCGSYCTVFLLAFLLLNPNDFKAACDNTDSPWADAGKMTGLLLHNCLRLSVVASPEQFLIVLQECLKRKCLLAFDRMLGRDVIELVDGVELVRYQKENETENSRALELSKDSSRFDHGDDDWESQMVQRLAQLSRTHVLKIHLTELNGHHFEGRHRRHKQNMFSQLLVFALLAAGVIVIPLGFQFLAILGGKALLLAKMALLMTSIQGLKKIATSNLNYGLYSYGHGPWHYDRKWPYEPEGHADSYSYSYENSPHNDILHPRQDYRDGGAY